MRQSNLFYEDENDELKPEFGVKPKVSISESIRNVTWHEKVEPEITKRQQEIYEIILNHPEGISSRGIEEIIHRELHCFSGRLTELANPKGYDKRPYHSPPLIEECGVDYHPDDEGRMTPYTKYRVRSAL